MAKQTTSLRVLRGSLCGTGAAVIGVYAGFCVYYHWHYFPHTTIGGISCGNQTADDLEDREYYYIGDYSRKVTDWNRYPATMDVREFYGGDLKGVWDKLDYLQDLGVEVL